jgi:hypothetical protein
MRDSLSYMRRWRGPWDTAAHAVAYYHLAGAIVSGTGWLIAAFNHLDRSWKIGLGYGFVYCLAVTAVALARQRWVSWRKRHSYLPLRRWLELRSYTNSGLTWMVVSKETVDGRGVVNLRISPTGGELPVPLNLEITCVGNIDGVFSGKIFPAEIDQYSDLHIFPTDGNKAYVTLVSPRFHPPVYLEIKIRSAGDDVKIRNVRRNPT